MMHPERLSSLDRQLVTEFSDRSGYLWPFRPAEAGLQTWFTGKTQGGGVEEAGASAAKQADEIDIFDAINVELVMKRFPVVRDGDAFQGAFAASAKNDAVG